MALVGSLSGSLNTGIVAVTGSLIPSTTKDSLGSNSFKWGTVYASSLTGSIRSTAGGNDIIAAGPNITVNYNALGQWEVTGTAAASAASVFKEASATAAYTTSSIAIGFNSAASSKGSDVFFAVSGSSPTSNTALFSGPVVASGSITVKDAGVTLGQISGTGVISGSALQTVGNLNVQGTSGLIGDVTVTGDVSVNGGDLNTTATTFNLINAGATVALNIGGATATTTIGSSTGKVIVPGDFEVQGTTMTVDVTNLTIEDPIVAFGFTTGSVAGSAGDRGFVGGITGAGNNVAFVWSNSNNSFAATKTTSVPGDTTISLTNLQPIRASSIQVNGIIAQVTSSDGSVIAVSGSQVDLKAGTAGAFFYRDGTSFLGIGSGSYGSSTGNAAKLTAIAKDIVVAAQPGYNAYISGSSGVYIDAGVSGTTFRRDGASIATIEQATAGTVSLTSAVATANVFNATATTVNIAGAATAISVGSSTGATTIKHNLIVTGSTYLGDTTSDVLEVKALVTGSLLPFGDVITDLGSPSNRWANIYTGDLHLRNDRGDYTLIEEEDFLSIRFNKTGKRYKFVLEPVPELDEK